ncbi:thiopurine s-methyltransferase [Plakobranchus ocellatus]|uniref:Thiopurine s-methyltransferase n=1 Tax=Plakobranchus ocellatus TaxID=259542 RepID=A0AAV3YDS0_9GAST|nr:thiopurine s-methyltransferase [Plakobranchus ocellatus]
MTPHICLVCLSQSKDGMIKLYCGDMLQFSSSFEGTLDAIWDRGSLVVLDRSDVPRLVKKLSVTNVNFL